MRNILAPALFLAPLLLCHPGRAATVTSNADSGPGSLRDTIANAAPGTTIDFAIGGTIQLTSGQLLVTKDLTIAGPGAAILTIQRSTASGTAEFRIFHLQSGIVSISGLAVSNGVDIIGAGIHNETTFSLRDSVIAGNLALGAGGGINNLGTLTMSNCVVNGNRVSPRSANSAPFQSGGGLNNENTVTVLSCVFSSNVAPFGGGIRSDGTLALTNSLVRGNSAGGILSAAGKGGGIYNEGTLSVHTTTIETNSAIGPSSGDKSLGGGIENVLGTVTLDRSTVSRNLVTGNPSGGGVDNLLGTLVVENSTISGNIASGSSPVGGAIANGQGSVLLNHSTVTANVLDPVGLSPDGGGLFNLGGVVEIKNTILAGNTSLADVVNYNLNGDILSGGFNLFGTTNGLIMPGPSDRFNFTAAALKVGALQNNGGPTFTHARLCGSPAIDAGDNTNAPATDQRGFPRIVRGVIDVGAYEDSNTPPTITCPTAVSLKCTPSTGDVATVSVNVADVDGDPLIVLWIVDGQAYQTNFLSGTTTNARVDLTATFGVGTHNVSVSATDTKACVAACSTTVTVEARGDLYPIALHQKNVAGMKVGDLLPNIYNGVRPGNFGWLTWAGSPNEPTLVKSLTPPGNSQTYVNPFNRRDHFVSVGDWVQGKPGVTNSREVRQQLDVLKQIDIVVPVWDRAMGGGHYSFYHVVGFAKVRITDYRLPNQNRITARFLGMVDCN